MLHVLQLLQTLSMLSALSLLSVLSVLSFVGKRGRRVGDALRGKAPRVRLLPSNTTSTNASWHGFGTPIQLAFG
jgi:hypothetical protein